MKNIIKKQTERIKKIQDRKAKRTAKIGRDGVAKQNSREFNEKVKGAFTKGDSATKAKGREAIKRVEEYKAGKFDKFAKGGMTGAPPVNTANMAVPAMKAGGICKGMGAASRGGKFGRNG
jgi:hypothetical protein